MLQKADFPEYFVNKQHPDDFKPIKTNLIEMIYHHRTDHTRLFFKNML
jgi:hypothetical protein